VGIGELVPAAAAVLHALDETAASQTREVVGHELAADAESVREVGGIGGLFPKGEQDRRARGIGQGMPESSDGSGMCEGGGECHASHSTDFDE